MFSKNVFLISCFLVTVNSWPQLDWWQTSAIYQIYPKSFKDSNGDGIGDLNGILERVSYFNETGIEVIWLSPIFKSPMIDAGYDVANFTEIDPMFGTMEDFDNLLRTLKSLDIKLLLDFVPNHSSDQCEWFQKSIKRIDPYTDFYVWRDPKEWTKNGTVPVPPNNWISVFQGSAWEYNAERRQFYLHEFLVEQPDFNYRSRNLVDEMLGALRFWLDKGVDGFRIDSIMYLYEDSKFPDEAVIRNDTIAGSLAYTSLNHTATLNQPETYDMTAEYRRLLDSYKEKDGHTRLLMTEAYTNLQKTQEYYGNNTKPMAQIPFNFFLLNLNYTSNASSFQNTINEWMNNMPPGQWANWVSDNHDKHRATARYNPEMIDGLNMLVLLLPGTGIVYYGDELGMEETKIRWDETNDGSALKLGPELYTTATRDPERTPFQWNSSFNAGFSTKKGSLWLPVNPNYYALNLENQKKSDRSHWKIFKELLKMKKTDLFLYGDLWVYVVSDWVLAVQRNIKDEEMAIVLLNLNNQEEYVNLKSAIPNLPDSFTVKLTSVNSEYNAGDKLNAGEVRNSTEDNSNSNDTTTNIGFRMRPNSALVLHAVTKPPGPAPFGSGAGPGISATYALRILFLAIGLFSSRLYTTLLLN